MEGGAPSARRRLHGGYALALVLLAGGMAPARAMPQPPAAYTVSRWSMDDGLPHNLVNAVAQDRSGLVWVGTWEGVAHFNGREFKAFDRQNTSGLEVSGVFAMQPDPDGGMLVGTVANGVYRYARGRWSQLGDAGVRHLPVDALQRDRDGALWLASRRDLYRIDAGGRSAKIEGRGLPARPIRTLLERGQGLLVGTEAGIHLLPRAGGPARAWPMASAGLHGVRAMVAGGDGEVIVSTDDGGWVCRDAGCSQHLHPGERIDAAVRDLRGNLWLAFNSGTLVRRAPDGTEQVMKLPGAVSPALLAGDDGVVWAGTNQGLVRIMEGVARGITREDGLGSDYVRTVTQTGDGTVWVGQAAGLDHIRGGHVAPVHLLPDGGQRQPSVLALAAAATGGGVWAGTYDAGVARVQADGRVSGWIGTAQGLDSLMVRSLAVDPDGLWIGTVTGLARYQDGRVRAYGPGDGLPEAMVLALYREPDGTLWIGTDQGMAWRTAGGKVHYWRPDADFPAQNAFDFLRDADGSLWVASDRGLLRLRRGRFRIYDHRVGLPRDAVFRVMDDGHGYLWLTSNRGVFRIARAQFDEVDAGRRAMLAVDVLDASDGLPGSQANGSSQPAGWVIRDGRILVPTSAGLGVISPGQVSSEHAPAVPVVIEAVAVDGGSQPVAPGQVLRGDVRRIAIDYAGLDYRAPAKVRYRYRLRGFEDGWVDAGTATRAIYTNLPPGRYRFEVQAMALPLDWRQQRHVGQAALDWYLRPQWWQRGWVHWLAGALAALVLAGLYLLRVSAFRQRQRRLNAEIDARTLELSTKNRSLEVLSREREALVRQLEYQAGHDALTGLPNRREAERQLRRRLVQAEQGMALAVALLDIDHFKHINDTYGHGVGDEVLGRIGTILAGLGDGRVFAARQGGEEFLLMLSGLDAGQVQVLLQRLCQRIRAIQVVTGAGPVHCTVSVGLAWYGAERCNRRDLLEAADRQLYRAKREGRDRIRVEGHGPGG